jgi:hypothetical protein
MEEQEEFERFGKRKDIRARLICQKVLFIEIFIEDGGGFR